MREALASEQTTRERNGTLAWLVHSLMDWATSAMDGAQNRTSLHPLAAMRASARRSAVRVLPVPQAMMAFARSWSSKEAWMRSIASR